MFYMSFYGQQISELLDSMLHMIKSKYGLLFLEFNGKAIWEKFYQKSVEIN